MIKTKILILANKDSGLYRFRKELMQKFISDGNEVFCSLPTEDFTENITDLGCKCIDTKISRHGTNPIEDIKLFFNYIKIINKIRPDVVLTYTIKPNIYGGLACSVKRIPYLSNITGLGVAIQNGGLMQKLTLFLYKLGLQKSKRIFFQNNSNLKFMKEKKIAKSSCCLLPGSGVNLEENCFEKYPDNDEIVNFLIIGRIMQDKGTDEILEAAKIIKKEHKNVNFTFIGPYDGDYRQKIEQAEKDGYVKHIEKQPCVHSFIKESHATLHASYHEGMSNVLLETAASGRPIIATDVPGCCETYDDGISGFSFKPRDVQSMVQAIEKFLLLTNEQKAQMGIAGRKKVEKEFDRNIIIEAYLKELSEIK